MMTTESTVLLPDLDGELLAELTALEEWAIDLEVSAEDGAELGIDAAATRAALAALWSTAAEAARQHPGRLLAPDGRYEYEPVRVARVPRARLDTLQATLTHCRATLAMGRPADLEDALEGAAERYHAAADPYRAHEESDPAAPVRTLARLLDVLTLSGPDVTSLRAALTDAATRHGDDIVLPMEAEAARGQVADRIAHAWYIGTGASAVHRWGMG